MNNSECPAGRTEAEEGHATSDFPTNALPPVTFHGSNNPSFDNNKEGGKKVSISVMLKTN